MATVSHAFAGYVQAIWPAVPVWAVILVFFSVLTLINWWGIEESSLTNIFCTAIEIIGILIVIAAGLKFFGKVDYWTLVPAEGKTPSGGFFQAGVLAFYAFIGFEDMANVAEETRQPEKFMPRAILTSLAVVAVLYVLTALAAVSAVPAGELAASSAPLLRVVEKGLPMVPRGLFSLIALFAVSNTALINFIMGSRLLYGMAKEGLVPSFLGRVHPVRRTPYVAIGVVVALATVLALTGTLLILAQSNSFILLTVFSLMNLCLIVIKLRPGEPKAPFQIPLIVPLLGAVSSLFLIFFVDPRAALTAAVLLLIGLLLYGLVRFLRPKHEPES